MRRRAAFYLLLGLTTALLIVALATGYQTGGSRDPNAWMWAHRHVPLLQMLDLASAFLFVVIGLYGLTVSRLQMQLQHQSEDYGDQMQTLLHRNEELAKVNDEYADEIAALETGQEERPALSMGDSSQRIVAALHRQVDAQAQQLEAVHQALDEQRSLLQNLRQHVDTLQESAVLQLTGSAATPLLSEDAQHDSELQNSEPPIEETPADPQHERTSLTGWTVNDGSTLIGQMMEFDVSGFAAPEAPPQQPPQAVKLAAARTYPVDTSLLAVAAGHLSSMPDTASAPPPEPERVEITVGASSASTPLAEPPADFEDLPPPRTQGAIALDMAESALCSLQSETNDALSSLRAQVEATIPQETSPPASGNDPVKPDQPTRRRPWHLRF